ncbi:MAG: flavin reductase family protein [Deltaproteobacteria bacterium]|nr:flavin reductase family protein [Deltaproteobacteria bacterium]MBK8691043.1 flavin reductase family protein [Deltaproteobacteria bacterium]
MAEGNAFETFAASDAAHYRTLARLWAASVTVVTVRPDDPARPDDGFTATAFLTVSIDPPIVLVSASNASSAASMMREAGAFAVNLLARDQRSLADAFAQPHEHRNFVWSDLPIVRDPAGVALLAGSLGAFSATVRSFVDAGDHTLVLGDVTALHLGHPGEALVYHDRAYGSVDPL